MDEKWKICNGIWVSDGIVGRLGCVGNVKEETKKTLFCGARELCLGLGMRL